MVPFIGALFGTHARELNDDESYMLVVPSVVEPVSMSQRDRVEEALRVYESFHGDVSSYHLQDQPRVGAKSTGGGTRP
jgi:type II secretory pathway component GspD/PulD (secretin)